MTPGGSSGNKHWNWKGGKRTIKGGYTKLLTKSHPNADCLGYVFEHRLIIEKHLGRFLTREEIVHHINGNPSDNRIENLKVLSISEHCSCHPEVQANMIAHRRGKPAWNKGLCKFNHPSLMGSSLKQKGKPLPIERKQKISETHKKNPYWKGKKFSAKHRKNLSIAHIKKSI